METTVGKKDKEEKKHKKDKDKKDKDKKQKHEEQEARPVPAKESDAEAKASGIEEPVATYSDGHPQDVVHYLEAKLILKPDRFTSVDSFRDFGQTRAAHGEESQSWVHRGPGDRPKARGQRNHFL